MKNKIILKSKNDILVWMNAANLFAKSRIDFAVALKQFNLLKPEQRKRIEDSFEEYDKIRRVKIPKGESDVEWLLSVMVDAHIIATENNIDPLTAAMCVNPICKMNENVIMKR